MRLSTIAIILPLGCCQPHYLEQGAVPPLITRDAGPEMANKYIVKFKDDTDVTTINAALESVGENTHTFEHVFGGFAARLDNLAVELLRQFPDVSPPSLVHHWPIADSR